MRQYYRQFRSSVLQRLIPRSTHAFPPDGPFDVTGFLGMTSGVAESARLCADALARDHIPLRLTDVSTSDAERADVEWASPRQASAEPRARILHLNPPMIPKALLKIGIGRFARQYNIGYWAWELEVIPDEWKNALRYMNAIFVPSEFTRQAIARHTAIPVITVPHPVSARAPSTGMRAQFGIPDDAFLVSSIFSAGSSINRKNPGAVLEAFRRFADGRRNAWLLMKASGDPTRDQRLNALVAAAAGGANVRVVTENLPTSAVSGIVHASDAYISLHRSEGFGLTVAEAILAGIPVVSTGWSGTVDFCDPENCWNTGFRLVPVIDSHPEFSGLKNARWADPDPGHAADQLTAIAADPVLARERAGRARDFLLRYLAENTYAKALGQLAGMQG